MSHDAKQLSVLYKRKGHFDSKREEILRNFTQSEAHAKLIDTVRSIVNEIVHKKPELLLKNKGQLAALIEGIILRNTTSGSFGLEVKELELGEMNVYELFEQEVRDSTEGSEELRVDIRAVLKELANGLQ